MQYVREDVCKEGSNKFNWKYAKKFLNEDFIEKLVAYKPLGPKSEPQPKYTLLNFLEKNISELVLEEVEIQCGIVMAKLLKWLQLCIKTRKEDITFRKALRQRAIGQIESLVQKEEERKQRMEQDLAEAEVKFAEDHKDEIDAVL